MECLDIADRFIGANSTLHATVVCTNVFVYQKQRLLVCVYFHGEKISRKKISKRINASAMHFGDN